MGSVRFGIEWDIFFGVMWKFCLGGGSVCSALRSSPISLSRKEDG